MIKILLVEDNEMNRDMLSRRLVRRQYEVITAENGRDGIDVSHEQMPDLIIMDVGLPLMDGWEATALLKASKVTGHIPIIILTAHATSDDRDKSRQVGADDYESKPVDMNRLIQKIEKLTLRGH